MMKMLVLGMIISVLLSIFCTTLASAMTSTGPDEEESSGNNLRKMLYPSYAHNRDKWDFYGAPDSRTPSIHDAWPASMARYSTLFNRNSRFPSQLALGLG